MPLKEKIKTALRLRGYMSNSELYEMCRIEGHKVSTAERRLREMTNPLDKNYTPEIKKDESGGAIHGYKWEQLMTEGAKRFLNQWCKQEVKEKITLF